MLKIVGFGSGAKDDTGSVSCNIVSTVNSWI